VRAGAALVLAGVLFQDAALRQTIDKGDDSAIRTARQTVVRTLDEWHALWREHAPERVEPTLDFSRSMVAAVFLGNRKSAGFSVEIASAREEEGVYVVRFREERPSADSMNAAVLTSPFHLVALPQTAAAVRFQQIQD